MKKISFFSLMLCAFVAAGEGQTASNKTPGVVAKVPKAIADSLTITAFDTVKKEQIPKSATFGSQSLTRTGTGIRQKKVVFIGVDVYRATLFVSDITKFVRKTDGMLALDSLSAMPVTALVLDFKRSVSGKDIANSFETALKKNGVKDSPAITQFKNAVRDGGDVVDGQRVMLSASKGTLTCEFDKKTVRIEGDAQFIRDVFSIWLGTPADDGLKALRDMLILGK